MEKVTTKEIAEKAGVSRATVSYVLNDNPKKTISKATRDKVLKIAKELNYRPDFFARGLRTGESKTIALIIQTLTDPTIPVLIKGIESEAYHFDYSVILSNNENSNGNKIKFVDELCNRGIDGLIYAYPDTKDDYDAINHLSQVRKVPVVVVGNRSEEQAEQQLHYIKYDYYQAGKLIAEYLYNLGHRDICYVMPGGFNSVRHLRIDGINSILTKHGIECCVLEKEKLESEDLYSEPFFDLSQYLITKELMETHFESMENTHSAYIASNSISASAILRVCIDKGIEIPKQLSIAAFGQSIVSETMEPKITYIEMPYYDMGSIACKTLIEVINNDRKDRYEHIRDISFKPKLIIKGTTATHDEL